MNMTSSSSEKRQHCINYILGIGCNTLSLELFIKLVGVIYHFLGLFIKLCGCYLSNLLGLLVKLFGVIYLLVLFIIFWGLVIKLFGVIYLLGLFIFFGGLVIKLFACYLSNFLGIICQTCWGYWSFFRSNFLVLFCANCWVIWFLTILCVFGIAPIDKFRRNCVKVIQ